MTAPSASDRPVGRVRFMDQQRVNLDGFAVENPELGLTAMRSPRDPDPSLVVRDGRVVELDGVLLRVERGSRPNKCRVGSGAFEITRL